MNRSRLGMSAWALAMLLYSSLAGATAPSDFQDAAWANGKQRKIYGSFSETPAAPGVTNVFIIGPVDGEHPLDEITLDPNYPYVHDHVIDKTPYEERKIATFNVVQPGPNATPENLKTRTVIANDQIPWIEPEDGSFHITPEREAPYAIDLGEGVEPLISTAVIQAGVDAGILSTTQIARDLVIVGWSGGTSHDTH